MKILFISHRFPWPLTRGDTLTVFKLAEYFGRRHTVDLLCGQAATPEASTKVKPLVRNLRTVPFSQTRAVLRTTANLVTNKPFQVAWCSSPELLAAAEQMHASNHYDVVIPYYIRTAEAARNLTHTRKIVAIQLSLAAQWKRAAQYASNPLVKAAKGMEARRLAAYEGRMFEEFNRCLVISNHDLGHMDKVDPAKVFFNPHGVDTVKFAPRDTAKKPGSIVFSGAMAFQPNEDAVCHFAEKIWPGIHAAVPCATWTIVGKNPTAKVTALARLPGVTVTGTVSKVEDYLAQAEVAINPLRIGGGLQNKLLEGMSMGLPMVASHVANEGIGATHGKHLLLTDQPGDFADHVINLLGDKTGRETLGRAARQFIEEKWTWEYHFARLEDLLKAETSLNAN